MRDALGVIYPHDLCADLSPQVGHYSAPPWRLALVTLMPLSENLTDRHAAEAVRGRLDWHYALGLDLTDTRFDFSLLSAWRPRLLVGAAEERLLTTMLDRFPDRGLRTSRGHQRTDATHSMAAVRSLNRLAMVSKTRHAALHALARVAPAWLRAAVTAAWFLRYGTAFSDSQQPKGKGKRQEVAETMGRNGRPLLTALSRATNQDVTVSATIHQTLEQHNRLPAGPVVAGVSTSGAKLVTSQHDDQIDLLGPMRQDQSWQTHDAQAFAIGHLRIVIGPRKSSAVPWAHRVSPGNCLRAPAASRHFKARFLARIVLRVGVGIDVPVAQPKLEG